MTPCPAAVAADDPEMAELAREEAAAQSQLLEDLARQLKVLLLPRDPLDERNIMLEVRRSFSGLRAATSMVKPFEHTG